MKFKQENVYRQIDLGFELKWQKLVKQRGDQREGMGI